MIFACVHSAGRSQMAAGFFNALADPSLGRAAAAGTQPAAEVYPQVIAAMREVGIDISGARPRALTQEMVERADLLVTMGCGDSCPTAPGVRQIDWPLAEPHGQPMERVREIRDDVRQRVQDLIADQRLAPEGARFSESG